MKSEEHDKKCAKLPHELHIFPQETTEESCRRAKKNKDESKTTDEEERVGYESFTDKVGWMFRLKVGKGKTGEISQKRGDKRQDARREEGKNACRKSAKK
jgi:hypothetical protein